MSETMTIPPPGEALVKKTPTVYFIDDSATNRNIFGLLAQSLAPDVTVKTFGDPAEALELLEREKCTSIMGWPNIIDRLREDPTFPTRDLSALSLPVVDLSARGHSRNAGMTETFGPHRNRQWFDYKVIDPASERELPDGDAPVYGGSGVGNLGTVRAEATPSHGREFSLLLTLPPLGALFLKPVG